MTAAQCSPNEGLRDHFIVQAARSWLTDAQAHDAATALRSLSAGGSSAERDLVTGWVAQFRAN